MKKMLFLVVVVTLTSAWTGCNRGWGGCLLCNKGNDMGEYATADACGCEQPCGQPCGNEGYTTRSPGVEYVQPQIPTPIPENMPMPGPATNVSPAR